MGGVGGGVWVRWVGGRVWVRKLGSFGILKILYLKC